jgi:hypothetical protein
VVEPEQGREGVGVGLAGFQLGDEVDLPAQQVLVAATQVEERVGQVAAQHRLLDRQVQGRGLDPVERHGHVGHLVAGLHGDRLDLGHVHVLAGRRPEDAEHRGGQPALGQDLGLMGQRFQRTGDRARDQPGRRHGGEER